MTDAETVSAALHDLPLGTFRTEVAGVDWIVTRTLFSRGASEKLVARALDGSDYISFNLYRLDRGPLLKPCEMPRAKVVAFMADLVQRR
ncbi:hypothetical protein JSE7799_01402 [Jannaschia seosinensis]|uniref:Peptide methionine sulfoxide reductase n=1 Tax=Jannaschia seosinensis TaxID=313367 RepID=A0A0M7BBH7_9RHOB|nr:hypothetical protein [Jannaschia seosinensis]CUH38369.1 hypothetical protein JSE7799_01402 [Jannaschia seosinensis]